SPTLFFVSHSTVQQRRLHLPFYHHFNTVIFSITAMGYKRITRILCPIYLGRMKIKWNSLDINRKWGSGVGSHSYPSAEVDATLETKMLSKVLKNNSLSLFNEKK
ncbi:hypothetical protein C5167_008564, partial [Papaver somniferum]